MTLLIEANAGTGKTNAIINNIINDLTVHGITINKLLVLTFTNKAANELKHRISQKLLAIRDKNRGIVSANLELLPFSHIGTIHSFCLRMLKQYSIQLGISPYFDIENSDKIDLITETILTEHINELRQFKQFEIKDIWHTFKEIIQHGLDPSKISRNSVHKIELDDRTMKSIETRYSGSLNDIETLKFLSTYKVKGSSLKNMVLCMDNEIIKLKAVLTKMYDKVIDKLYQEGFLTYEMLISSARKLLRENRQVRMSEKKKFQKIYMDELQDTDPQQYEILLYLGEKLENFSRNPSKIKLQEDKLCIVGDWKQSIYGFRGADLASLLSLKETLKENNCSFKVLKTNYRSCSNIVYFSNKLASNLFGEDISDSRHTFKCNRKNCVTIYECPATKQKEQGLIKEAQFITSLIARFRRSEPNDSIAVLFRKMTRVHILVNELEKSAIPYSIEDSRFVFNTPEVIDFINMLMYLLHGRDSPFFLGVLRSTFIPLNDDEVFSFIKNKTLRDRQLKKYTINFLETLDAIADKISSLSPVDLIRTILRELPILDALDSLPDAGVKKEYIKSIYKLSFEYINSDSESFIRKLYENCIKPPSDMSNMPIISRGNSVIITTIHKSKGLEFDNVIVPLSDFEIKKNIYRNGVSYDWKTDRVGIKCSGQFNTDYFLAQQKKDDEIKRELYVAFTRAKKKLTITDFSKEKKLFKLLPEQFTKRSIIINAEQIKPATARKKNLELNKGTYSHINISEHTIKMEPRTSLIPGEAAHYVMEHINHKRPLKKTGLKQLVTRFYEQKTSIPTAFAGKEIETITSYLDDFIKSDCFKWIQSCRILCREETFYTHENNKAMAIRPDLILMDSKGSIWILDYKYTDKLSDENLKEYQIQLDNYSKALKHYYPKAKNIKKGLVLLKSRKLMQC